MGVVRNVLIILIRFVCVCGGHAMDWLAWLFLTIAQLFGWTGGAFSYASDWLFARANALRARGATGAGGAS